MADEGQNVYQDIKALQSSILVLRQKLKYLVHNEKILGRNILILNKKIASNNNSDSEGSFASNDKLDKILAKVEEFDSRIKGIESTLEMFSKRYARQEDLKEMKYIIDNINPLEYTTIDQVKKMLKDDKNDK
jgi:hypothetical protein